MEKSPCLQMSIIYLKEKLDVIERIMPNKVPCIYQTFDTKIDNKNEAA